MLMLTKKHLVNVGKDFVAIHMRGAFHQHCHAMMMRTIIANVIGLYFRLKIL
jgi:hypothetical protein